MSEQKPLEHTPQNPMTGRQAYNLVTDTVGGPNVRLRDNLYQGLAILICLLLGAGIGFLTINDWLMGVLLGSFIGLLVGLFGSGIFLMLYRGFRIATCNCCPGCAHPLGGAGLIEKTSKRWKLLQLVGAIVFFIGVITICAGFAGFAARDNQWPGLFGIIGGIFMAVGFITCLMGSIGAWWYHG